MLQKLELKNFQSHSKKVIEFDPEITTIVGPSDAGKTAILRALSLVVKNKPSGKAFIKDGKKTSVIKLTVDGKTITRIRGTKNVYQFDGKKFKAFGNKVPEPIERFLNLGAVNFQKQLDLPFWFTDSPGQVSKNLNEIVNLSTIDNVLAKAKSQVRTTENRYATTKERIQEAEQTVKELKWIKDFIKRVETLKEMAKYHSVVKDNILRLRRIVRDVENIKRVEIPDIEPLKKLREKADKVAEKRRNLEMVIEELKDKQEQIDSIQESVKHTKSKLKKFSGRCPTCKQKLPKLKSSLSYAPISTSLKRPQ